MSGSVGKGATCAWTTAHAEADRHPESILPFGVEFTSARPLGVMWASRTLARNSILGDGSSLVAQRLLTFLRQPSAFRADHAIRKLPWAPLASSRRVQTGCLSWTRASSSHGSPSKQWATIGSIKGPTGRRKFEMRPGWGASRFPCFLTLPFCFFALPVRASNAVPQWIRTPGGHHAQPM